MIGHSGINCKEKAEIMKCSILIPTLNINTYVDTKNIYSIYFVTNGKNTEKLKYQINFNKNQFINMVHLRSKKDGCNYNEPPMNGTHIPNPQLPKSKKQTTYSRIIRRKYQ